MHLVQQIDFTLYVTVAAILIDPQSETAKTNELSTKLHDVIEKLALATGYSTWCITIV